MYIYQIITGEYEYSCERLLCHKNKYSDEEFKEIIKGAVNYLKNKKLDYNDDTEVIDVLKNIYKFQEYKLPIQAQRMFDWCISQVLDEK